MFHTNKNRISEVVTKPVMQYTKANNLYIKNFDPEKYSSGSDELHDVIIKIESKLNVIKRVFI